MEDYASPCCCNCRDLKKDGSWILTEDSNHWPTIGISDDEHGSSEGTGEGLCEVREQEMPWIRCDEPVLLVGK